MFRKILVANRGEIAVRIIRACRELGIRTVLAHSEPDRRSLGAQMADETICIGPGPSDRSYLNIASVLSAAEVSRADAIHPGYGFLSENKYLASATAELGLTFIGPPAAAIEAFGDKVAARRLMRSAGVPIVPGTDAPVTSVEVAVEAARSMEFPLMVKAAAGGGGRGLRAVRDVDELTRQFPLAQAEAQSAFSDGSLYLERYIERGRHVEVQVAADRFGNFVHLFERECSLQRRHQKIVEESPSPALPSDHAAQMGEMAVAGLRAAGYCNLGTVEFLVDQSGAFYFLEVNARLQVEHPVTEMVTGIDLLKLQIKLAAGGRLPFKQEAIQRTGHAIECRVTAEDPLRNFAPTSGQIHSVLLPGGPWVRVDTHVTSGYNVPPYYDSLLAKIIVWGSSRREAIRRMQRALSETAFEGIPTNLEYLASLLASREVQAGEMDVEFISRHLAVTGSPAPR